MRQGHVVGPGCVGGADDVRSAPEGVVDGADGAVVLQVAALLVAEPEGQRVDALVVGALPVTVKLVDVWMPLGPEMVVVGVWSSVLNDSNFLVAGVESAVPPVAAVNAVAVTMHVAVGTVIVAGIVQVRVVPVPRQRRVQRVRAGAERGESGAVILEVLAAVAVLDLHLDPTDGAGVDRVRCR